MGDLTPSGEHTAQGIDDVLENHVNQCRPNTVDGKKKNTFINQNPSNELFFHFRSWHQGSLTQAFKVGIIFDSPHCLGPCVLLVTPLKPLFTPSFPLKGS